VGSLRIGRGKFMGRLERGKTLEFPVGHREIFVKIVVLKVRVSQKFKSASRQATQVCRQLDMYLAYLYYSFSHVVGLLKMALGVASVEAEFAKELRSWGVGERVLLRVALTQLPRRLEHQGRVLCCGRRGRCNDRGGCCRCNRKVGHGGGCVRVCPLGVHRGGPELVSEIWGGHIAGAFYGNEQPLRASEECNVVLFRGRGEVQPSMGDGGAGLEARGKHNGTRRSRPASPAHGGCV
jgi:hypothetical protein